MTIEQCPIIPDIKNGSWRVYANYTYTTKSGIPIVIEEGFRTDLASVPLLFRWRYPKCRFDYSTASIVHDKILKIGMPRKFADIVFREILDLTTDERTEEIFFDAVSLYSKFKRWWHGE